MGLDALEHAMHPEVHEATLPRWKNFNVTTGALTWNYRSAAEHPDRCVCQGDDPTPHKHYSDPQHACARCSGCGKYRAAVARQLEPPRPLHVVTQHFFRPGWRDALKLAAGWHYGFTVRTEWAPGVDPVTTAPIACIATLQEMPPPWWESWRRFWRESQRDA